ncbi:hypothetical protein Tco_0223710 [Tanacetum coccineum]
MHARIRRIFLDGYDTLVFRIVIFKISSFKLQNDNIRYRTVQRSIFRDSVSPSTAGTYVPKRNVINDSALDDPDVCQMQCGVSRQACFSAEVRLRSEHNYREKKKFERRCQRKTILLKEKDAEISSLKAYLSLKEAVAVEAIRLCGLVATVEATETARANELIGLKEWYSVLEEEKNVLEKKIMVFDSADTAKETELTSLTAQTAKLTQDLSELEGTCSGLHDEVSGYMLFKEQVEVVQDEQLKVLSDRVAGLDAELMGMALHLDEEFYPHFFTTIVGPRWILSCSLRLVVMKYLQSLEYLAALGGAISRAIDKGIQDGRVFSINHGKAEKGLVDVVSYNLSAEANYISVVNALCVVDFPLLAQLVSQKDASIVNIMVLLHLEGPVAETSKANQLQPSFEQLLLPIHHPKDQVVIGETFLSFSLDVVHARVQRIRRDVTSQRLSIFDAMVALIEPLYAENLVGEASTSGVPATVAATTALLTTFFKLAPFLLCQCQLMMRNRMLKFLLPP